MKNDLFSSSEDRPKEILDDDSVERDELIQGLADRYLAQELVSPTFKKKLKKQKGLRKNKGLQKMASIRSKISIRTSRLAKRRQTSMDSMSGSISDYEKESVIE